MKRDIISVILLYIIATIFAIVNVSGQPKKAWEFGAGISIYQFNRVNDVYSVIDEDGVSKIGLTMDHAVYSGHLYVGKELNEKGTWAADFQGNIGTIDKKFLTQLGVGLQYRFGYYFSKPNSPYIDPFVRVGVNYMCKGKHILYHSDENVTWSMWNKNNADGDDAQHILPIMAGVGVNMWLNDKWGIGLQGDYLYMPKNNMANSIQGTVRVMYRLGGKSKKPENAHVTEYVDKEVIKEVVHEIIKVDTVKIETEKQVVINSLLQSIYFDYDKSEVKPEYNGIIKFIAEYLNSLYANNKDVLILVSGFTDSKGSVSYNKSLSERRAMAVKRALIDNGVPFEILKSNGEGSLVAKANITSTDDIRKFDRKVNIEIIDSLEYWDNLK